MTDLVTFLPSAVEHPGRKGVSFTACVDSQTIRCSISALALESYFHAESTDLMSAFLAHRGEIENLAETMVRAGAIRRGALRIELQDLVRSTVAFEQSDRPPNKLPRRRPQKG